MSKKRLLKNKPNQGDLGIYTFDDSNTEINYQDSDSLPTRWDKFEGKDLQSNSIGHTLNEAICDSNIQNQIQPFDGTVGVSDLKFTGQSSIEVHYVDVQNRGVNSRINDDYYQLFMFSSLYFNPYNADGTQKNHDELKSGMKKFGEQARFYHKSGPGYNENQAPRTGMFSDIVIARAFDTTRRGYGGISENTAVDNETVDTPEDFTGARAEFDPKNTMLISCLEEDENGNLVELSITNGTPTPHIPPGNITTLFQEDGAPNPIYIGGFFDGDLNPKNGPDRSRQETATIWSFSPEELFDVDQNGNLIPKVTTLTWDNHEFEKYGGHGKAPAWTAKGLSITINTLGGIEEETPQYEAMPKEYEDLIDDVFPPLPLLNQNQIDLLITQMHPNREIITSPTIMDLNLTDSNSIRYTGPYSDYLPIPYVELPASNNDFQIYYEDEKDRILMSAPNTVNLSFDISIHPEPFKAGVDYSDGTGNEPMHPYYNLGVYSLFPSDENYGENEYGIQLDGRFGFTEFDMYNLDDGSDFTMDNINESDYMFLVIDWDDRQNKYETIDQVMGDWPVTLGELTEKRNDNLYIPQFISNTTQLGLRNSLQHNYSTPGMKVIKTIMVSFSSKLRSSTSTYEEIIQPIRWKLITTKIFLDIPTNEFPDFGQVGGNDYTTIPWPYTTPVIGGVSRDSKYYKSIDDILGGGRLGDLDIIDETFLVGAKENDELGVNIQTMDLEQVRYFNNGIYDMNTILEIPTNTNTAVDVSPSYLATLPFPFWWEEFNVLNYIPLEDVTLSVDDAMAWDSYYKRPDIADYMLRQINGQSLEDSLYTFFNNDYYDNNDPIWPPHHYPTDETIMHSEEPNPIIMSDDTPNYRFPTPPVLLSNPFPQQSGELSLMSMGGNTDTGIGGGEDDDSVMGGTPSGTWFDCFIAGTKILLSDNSYKNIEDININDVVKSYNIETKKIEDKKVNHIYDTIHTGEKNDYTIIVSFKDIENHNTFTNPYWVVGKGWCSYNPIETYKKYKIKVKQLEIGDVCLIYKDGVLVENKILNIEEVFDEIHTYNFHVDDNHNYFANNILVHNKHGGEHEEGTDQGSTTLPVYGCMDPFAYTYDENANAGNQEDLCNYRDGYYTYQTVELWKTYIQSISSFGAASNQAQAAVNQHFGELNINNNDGTINTNLRFNDIDCGYSLTGSGSGIQLTSNYFYFPYAVKLQSGNYNMRSAMCLYQILWLMIHPHPGYEAGYYQYEYESEPFWEEGDRYDGIIQYLIGEADFSQPPYKNDPRVEDEGPYVDNVLGGNVTVDAFRDNYYYENMGSPSPGIYGEVGSSQSDIVSPISGCELAPNQIFLASNGDLLYHLAYNLGDDIPIQSKLAGFQFKLPYGTNVEGVLKTGYAAENLNVQFYENTLVAFSFTGASIGGNNPNPSTPTSNCGTLLNLNLSVPWIDGPVQFGGQDIYMSGFTTFSNPLAEEIQFSYYEFPPGCTDSLATNYEYYAAIDDGSCEYTDMISIDTFSNIDPTLDVEVYTHPYDEIITDDDGNVERYWNAETTIRTFSDTISVGQIFIDDNIDFNLRNNCKLEFNVGSITDKSIYDSSGNANKGLLIGDYKIKKTQKNEPMRRDSFIKTPNVTGNNEGAL